MKAIGLTIGSVLLGLVSASCTEPSVKLPEEVVQIERIDRLIGEIQDLVEKKDLDGLAAKYTFSGQALEKMIAMINEIEEPKLVMVIDRIVINGDRARVKLHWDFEWKIPKKDATLTRNGNAELQLVLSERLSIESILGDDPLLAPQSGSTRLP